MRRLLSDPEEQLFCAVLIARGNLQPPNSKQLKSFFERARCRYAAPGGHKNKIFELGPNACGIQRPAAESTARAIGAWHNSVKDQRRNRTINKIVAEGRLSDSPRNVSSQHAVDLTMPELREPTNLAGFDRRSLETAFERI